MVTDSETETIDWHDAYLCESHETIIECLSGKGESIVDITLTPKGIRIVEACDGHYGITLSKTQVDKLVRELQKMSEMIRTTS